MAYNFITDPSGYMNSQEFADIIAGICGDGTIVFDVGKKMEASMADVNTLRIMDGIAVSGNQIIGITAGTSVDFAIPAGTEGVNNTYYVGYRLSNGDTQTMEPVVHKTMTNTESRLRNGDTAQNVYLYKVVQKGYVVDSITALYSYFGVKTTDKEETTVVFTDKTASSQKNLNVILKKKNGIVTLSTHNVLEMKSAQSVTLSGTIPAEYLPEDTITIQCVLVNNYRRAGDARFLIDRNGTLKYVSSASGWQEVFMSASWIAKEV